LEEIVLQRLAYFFETKSVLGKMKNSKEEISKQLETCHLELMNLNETLQVSENSKEKPIVKLINIGVQVNLEDDF